MVENTMMYHRGAGIVGTTIRQLSRYRLNIWL